MSQVAGYDKDEGTYKMAHRFSVEEVEREIDEDEPSPRQQAYNLF